VVLKPLKSSANLFTCIVTLTHYKLIQFQPEQFAMHFLHPFLLTLLPLVHNVSGQLYGSYIDKPAISTGFQYDNFDYDLDKFLKAKGAQSWTITPWKNSTIIPQYCHSSANDNGVASINVDVANIRFDDCFRDWTICRTQNGTVNWDNIARVSVRSCFCSPELIV